MVEPTEILARHARALERRRPFEPIWQACYDHVLPSPSGGPALFDATAADAAEQLAASLLAELTPPWSRWFGLAPTRPVEDTPQGRAVAEALEDAAATLQGHFDRSNFAIEMHQAFLDLVVTGTGLLLVEEAPLGEASAFRFTAVPLRSAVLEEGPTGRLDTVFRQARLSAAEIRHRYPSAELPPDLARAATRDDPAPLPVLEAVWPDRSGIRYAALLTAEPDRPV
ncbi:MAG: phage tail protein, partial [Acetobacteraceae bacterium]|nr:phage tail protein [Acetobacteraceae bacterium]